MSVFVSISTKCNEMKHLYLYTLLLFLSGSFFSCVKEQHRDKCLPEYSIALDVMDKNYSNIGDIVGLLPKDEQLPFKEYVADISYRLINPATGEVVTTVTGQKVEGGNLLETIYFPGLPSGRYIFSAFGNLSLAPEVRDGKLVAQLHPDNQEGGDTYVAYDTIDFSGSMTGKKVELQRTKGYLFLQMEGVPDSVARIDVFVDGVYREVDQNLNYGVETSVTKSFIGNVNPSSLLLATLSPTVTGKESTLRVAFYKAGETTPFMYLPDIRMVVKRNEVSAFKISYQPQGGVEIWMSVEGAWVKLHDMDFQ